MPERAAPTTLESLSAMVPGSTPDLLRWLDQQLQAGQKEATLLQSLRDTGWSDTVARQAFAQVVRWRSAPAPQAAPPIPEPDLRRSPTDIDVGDRAVHVLMALEHPRIVLFGNLLSADECDAIVAAARPQMARSRTVETRTGSEEINADRTSQGMFFVRGQTPEVARLEARLARLLQWPLENGEGLQVLHYGPGAEYKPHHDYFDPAEPGTATIVRRGGQRVGTIVIYLNDPEEGGGTSFPEARLRIQPRKGNAVFFSYAQPQAHTLTLHGGDPVLRGEKWIATKWLREREFH
ncbi:2OG-Fe(II) oxygenase [Comamonas terrigena]|jgi:prolyl 4-hydroxylase|uniref:2OG-Fe(II) oxygenase n=1 Tax=Comamonas terrigena TaxID=32013 RepID=UPI00244A655E|nr:2OG-Fe(II) oxygenase [Comamonas terrigena]MDH0047688.1 2OG-Fe(II) oxygenase [Comamonas terrigena]MDH0510108.1 2OG-Fe(II) oxygenase [Comamonas terrigena]MDH1089514.1 2OG-Fe(II) oxygenase [Comamonas terrigena]MDH1500781.1 2OG-Fe(II) oxygenase [Comamonas terrigena]